MMIDQNLKIQKINKLARNFCQKDRRRKELEKLARECGWNIRKGGREQLIAYRNEYESIPIPGHNKSSFIVGDLLLKVTKGLFEPIVDDELKRDYIKYISEAKVVLENDLQNQILRAEDAVQWNTILEEDNNRLRGDVEISLQLAESTEIRNQKLGSRITHLQHRFARFLREFRNQLLQVRRLQEENDELMKGLESISIKIRRKEVNEDNFINSLKRFSSGLDPRNQDRLDQIIRVFREEI